MPINPLQGGFVPTDITALEQHEPLKQEQQQQQQQVKNNELQNQDPNFNPDMAMVLQPQGEAIPIQQSQESGDINYTDRESQNQQEQDENAVEEMEEKTKKSIADLQKGLEQVAEGITQLKELSQKEDGTAVRLEERLDRIATLGRHVMQEIAQTLTMTVDQILALNQSFFGTAVAELVGVRGCVNIFLADIALRQQRIPTPEVRDQSNRARSMRTHKQKLTQLLADGSEITNSMLENAENGLRELLTGNEEIGSGFATVNKGDADGFKTIETGFRRLFGSITTITNIVSLFRNEFEQLSRSISVIPDQLAKEIGGRNALGLSDRLSAPLWQTAELCDQRWRTIQGHLSTLSAALIRFGAQVEVHFEKASREIVNEGQITVEGVNNDLGRMKGDANKALSPSAAQAVDQILDGADQVETALENIVEAGEKKHKTIKHGSVSSKLPSHFNVRL